MNPALGDVLATDDGSLTMIHPDHGEAYHSRLGATAEARLLYVEASGIRARFADATETRVLDIGLGLAYNAIQTLAAWAEAPRPGTLTLQSLEINPALVQVLAAGTAPWQTTWTDAHRAFCSALRQTSLNTWAANFPAFGASWIIHVGDAREATLDGPFAYFWQDPFSPEKNPPLWDAAFFTKLRAAAAPDALLMTYSVARTVRDALAAAGWKPERFPAAPGHKRQWLRATV